jgi:hypothetical protein
MESVVLVFLDAVHICAMEPMAHRAHVYYVQVTRIEARWNVLDYED